MVNLDIVRTEVGDGSPGNVVLRQLSDEQRDAIMLKYYYGYRYSEMTEILCADESTIRMRVFRAKNKLRELLGDEVYERMQF